jgi:hypothetical protein
MVDLFPRCVKWSCNVTDSIEPEVEKGTHLMLALYHLSPTPTTNLPLGKQFRLSCFLRNCYTVSEELDNLYIYFHACLLRSRLCQIDLGVL